MSTLLSKHSDYLCYPWTQEDRRFSCHMYSPNWSKESKKRFAELLPEIWALVAQTHGEEDISQDRFGSEFGVSGTTVQGWLRGSIPETPKLKKMASLLSWSLDEFVCFLETGTRPDEQSQMHQLLYKVNNLSVRDLAMLIEAGAKRLAAEVTQSHKVLPAAKK